MERVERRGAEKKRVRRMRECEHDNDRVSERGSVNERLTERDESMWNTKGETTATSLTARLYLSLSAFRIFILLFHIYLFFKSPSPHLLPVLRHLPSPASTCSSVAHLFGSSFPPLIIYSYEHTQH